mgnify:CR=1 FL=1
MRQDISWLTTYADYTRRSKRRRFKKGHIVTKEDIPVLAVYWGNSTIFVWEQRNGFLHENEAAQRLAALCQNKDIVMSQVSEGKIELFASRDGLFQVDVKRLNIVNSIDNLIVATRHTNTAVRKGDKLAGVRVVPLVIEEKTIKQAERFIPKSTLLSLSPWKRKTCGLIITGSEVAQGLVRDAFAPALEEKLSGYGMRIAERCFPGDDQQAIAKAAVSYWKKRLGYGDLHRRNECGSG